MIDEHQKVSKREITFCFVLLQCLSQWKAGEGRETAPSRPRVTPAGRRRTTAAETSGAPPAPRVAAPPTTLEAGVKLTEERGATSR